LERGLLVFDLSPWPSTPAKPCLLLIPQKILPKKIFWQAPSRTN
jgi:hypothetical protein